MNEHSDIAAGAAAERAERLTREAGDRGRPAIVPVAVCGASTVLAQIERALTQGRRERVGLGLLCVGVQRLAGADVPVCAMLEQRVRDEVALRLHRAIRATDRLLRESERDAVVLLPGADADTVRRVIDRLHRVLGGAYTVDGARLQVRVRIGGATPAGDGARAIDLLRSALTGT